MVGTDAEFYVASTLPFGRWTLADGREILFNGLEEPLWQRRLGSEATQVDPHTHITGIVCIERFFTAACRYYDRREIGKRWLDEFRSGARVTAQPETKEWIVAPDRIISDRWGKKAARG